MESFFFFVSLVYRDSNGHLETRRKRNSEPCRVAENAREMLAFQRKGPWHRQALLRHVKKAKNLAPDAESLQGEVLPKNVKLVASAGKRANARLSNDAVAMNHSLLSRVKCRWNLETNSCSTSQR